MRRSCGTSARASALRRCPGDQSGSTRKTIATMTILPNQARTRKSVAGTMPPEAQFRQTHRGCEVEHVPGEPEQQRPEQDHDREHREASSQPRRDEQAHPEGVQDDSEGLTHRPSPTRAASRRGDDGRLAGRQGGVGGAAVHRLWATLAPCLRALVDGEAELVVCASADRPSTAPGRSPHRRARASSAVGNGRSPRRARVVPPLRRPGPRCPRR